MLMVSKDLQDFMCIPQVTQTVPIKHYLDDVLMVIMIFFLRSGIKLVFIAKEQSDNDFINNFIIW